MKKTMIGLISLLMLSAAGMAGATPYSGFKDYAGVAYTATNGDTRTAVLISDTALWTDTIPVVFNPQAASVTSALLTVDYAKVGNTNSEVWIFSSSGNSTFIGQLSGNGNSGNWFSNTFTINNALLSGVSGSNWSFGIKLAESTADIDTFYLDKITLSGEYTEVNINGGNSGGNAPVPEPGTMALLGFGMLGLAVFGKRRMKKD